jgi:tryptophanyl-tRNA synthetase
VTTVLSGIKPTGTVHLGNYLGFLRPALELAEVGDRCCYFIADYHALNLLPDPEELRSRTYDLAATMLALGLDPRRAALYRQSDLPQVFELACVLAAVTPKGLMNRAHAYKAAVAANREAGAADDDGVNMGLFSYPILMAADILVVGGDLVPVGRDQAQHVEIARDLAAAFNRAYGPTLRMPEMSEPDAGTLVGIDGRKMGKSNHNVIPLFAERPELERLVRRIRTDSRAPAEPKDPEGCPVFQLYRHFGRPGEVEELRGRYLSGDIGYAEAKALVVEAVDREIGPRREVFTELRTDRRALDEVLAEGAERAGALATATLDRVRAAIGSDRRLRAG